MTTVRVVLILIAFVVLLIVAVENSAYLADVRLFGREFTSVPLSIVMLYSLAFGAACVGIFTVISEIRLRMRLRRQQREIDALTEELRAFRNAPLGSSETAEPVRKTAAEPQVDHEIEED